MAEPTLLHEVAELVREGIAQPRLLWQLAVVAAGLPDRHQCRATFGHDRTHIREVQVDQTWDSDQFRDALYALAQYVIGYPKGFLQV